MLLNQTCPVDVTNKYTQAYSNVSFILLTCSKSAFTLESAKCCPIGCLPEEVKSIKL